MTVDTHMRETDAFSWSMEGDPRLRMTVTAVARLDGSPDWAEVIRRADRLSRTVPLFRQRVVPTPGGVAPPKWVVDPGFDLGWHLRRAVVPPPGTWDTVLDLAAKIGSAAFDPARALWEVWLLEGLADGQAALVLKVHHTLTDGLGGVQVLDTLFDHGSAGPARLPLPPPPAGGSTEPLRLIASGLTHNGRRAVAATGGAWQAAAHTVGAARHGVVPAVRGAMATWGTLLEALAPTGAELSPVMTGRGLSRRYACLDVPLADLRAAGTRAGGTINDAFLTAVTGGMRHYHELHHAPVDELRVTLPVSLRRPGDPIAGNRIALIRYLLPLQPADPVARLRVIQARTQRWKDAPGLAYMEAAYAVVNRLPAPYLRGLATHVDLVASNVPGFPDTVHLAGPQLLAFYSFSPTGGTAVNITMMSYAATVHVGINADTHAVPDVDALVASLHRGFEELPGARPHRAGRLRHA